MALFADLSRAFLGLPMLFSCAFSPSLLMVLNGSDSLFSCVFSDFSEFNGSESVFLCFSLCILCFLLVSSLFPFCFLLSFVILLVLNDIL